VRVWLDGLDVREEDSRRLVDDVSIQHTPGETAVVPRKATSHRLS
jgi:hypothetical protein